MMTVITMRECVQTREIKNEIREREKKNEVNGELYIKFSIVESTFLFGFTQKS